MAVDQRKVSLISEFLEESFVGCSVYDWEDEESLAQCYRIVDDTSGELLHRVSVSRAFLDHHAEAEIVSALQNLALLVCLRMAGGRPVIVRSQMIEIEKVTRRTADPFL
jgi:hypothetical protein